jgi:hypothetical protein
MHGFIRDKKMRLWLSGPRLFNGLVRQISLGREDLLAWRRPPSCRRRECLPAIGRSSCRGAGAYRVAAAREARGGSEVGDKPER